MLFKFNSIQQAEKFKENITSRPEKCRCICDILIKDKFLFVDILDSRIEEELVFPISMLASEYGGCFVPPDKINFELIKYRFKEFYSKCVPLEDFSSSENKLCRLSADIDFGGKIYAFVEKYSIKYLQSLLTLKYALKFIHFDFPRSLEDFSVCMEQAKLKKRLINIIDYADSFITKEILKESISMESTPYVNIFIIATDYDKILDLIYDNQIIYIERKE